MHTEIRIAMAHGHAHVRAQAAQSAVARDQIPKYSSSGRKEGGVKGVVQVRDK